MVDANPNYPKVMGPELTPRTNFQRPKQVPVSGGGDGLLQTWAATASQTVDSMAVWCSNSQLGTFDPYVVVETLIGGQEVAVNRGQTQYPPNASSQSGITGSYLNVISGSSELHNSSTTATGTIDFDFATAGFFSVGRRVTGLRFEVWVEATVFDGDAYLIADFDGGGIGASIGSWIQLLGSADADGDAVEVPRKVLTFDLGEFDARGFASSTPFWTAAKIQALDSGSDRFSLQLVPDGEATIKVSKVSAIVTYCDENRVTTDFVPVLAAGTSDPVWCSFTPHKIDLTANFGKVNGTTYTTCIRAPRYGNAQPFSNLGQALALVVPTSTDVPALFPDVRTAPTLNIDGTIASFGSDVDPMLFAPLDMLVAGVMTADSQVWAFGDDADGAPRTALAQEFTQSTGSPVTVVGARLLGKYQPDQNGNVANLTVALKRRSDNVVMATATISKADVDAAPDGADIGYEGYSLIQVPFLASFAMVSGTQYYLDLSSTHLDDWVFPVLRVSNISAGGAQSWHSTTDRGQFGASEQDYWDFPWLLYQAVAAPTGLTATPDSLPLEEISITNRGPFDRFISGVGFNHLAWTSTALGSLFGRYTIQRRDDYSDWEDIAYILTEGALAFDDYEARLGLPSEYRIRAETTAGIVSAWSATATATAPVDAPGLTFTTNLSPVSSIGYTDFYSATSAERVWASPEADELVLHRLAGRDYVAGFQPCERRGETFTRQVYVNAISTPSIVGIRAFDLLRDMPRTASPGYVCVRDHEGNRWFTAMAVPEIRIRNPRSFYSATVTLTTVSDIPYPAVV